jgi:hypothetical protein
VRPSSASHACATELPVGAAQELDELGVVGRFGAEPPCALDGLDDETRVVHLRVVVEPGGAQAVLAEVARVLRHLVGRQHPEARRAAEVREPPVHAERRAHLPRRGVAVLPGAKQKRQRLHEIRVHAQQQVALATGFARDREVAVREVAQAAVHHLRRTTRGARREVVALDEQRPQPARRRVAQHAGADDAAADHQHVHPVALGARERGASLAERPRRLQSSFPGFITPEGSTARFRARSASTPSTPFSRTIHGW